MHSNHPGMIFKSALNPSKTMRFEAAIGAVKDGRFEPDGEPAKYFKRITIEDADGKKEFLLDFATLLNICEHLTTVLELARGDGFGPEDDRATENTLRD